MRRNHVSDLGDDRVLGDVADLLSLMPFAVTLGVVLDSASPAEVRGRLDWAPDRCTADGVVHGGALMALADSLGAICAYLNLPPGAQTATITSATSFIRGIREGSVMGISRPLHAGRTVIVVQTDLLDGAGRLAAQVTQSQSVLTRAT
jgi:uncharacterized protein (TIGR00369 family)